MAFIQYLIVLTMVFADSTNACAIDIFRLSEGGKFKWIKVWFFTKFFKLFQDVFSREFMEYWPILLHFAYNRLFNNINETFISTCFWNFDIYELKFLTQSLKRSSRNSCIWCFHFVFSSEIYRLLCLGITFWTLCHLSDRVQIAKCHWESHAFDVSHPFIVWERWSILFSGR